MPRKFAEPSTLEQGFGTRDVRPVGVARENVACRRACLLAHAVRRERFELQVAGFGGQRGGGAESALVLGEQRERRAGVTLIQRRSRALDQ